MKLKLVSRKKEAENVESFIFEPPRPIKWQPGQYLHYKLLHDNADNRGGGRWFTNSAAPFEGHVAITTRFTPDKGSTFKNALKELLPGDIIEAEEPRGNFELTDPNQKSVFIAGGIGITPFRSILVQADHDNWNPHVDLLYANKDQDVLFKRKLETIAGRRDNFKIHYFIAEERITEADIKSIDSELTAIYYLSGPRPMVEAYQSMLEKMGLTGEQIKLDYFPGYQ